MRNVLAGAAAIAASVMASALTVVSYERGFLVSSFTPMGPVPSPAVRADGGNKFWVLLEDLEWEIGSTKEVIRVPAGFVTDYASIPQPLWSFGLTPHGQYSRAAIVHDFLYWSQGCSRSQSDRLMVIAMKESEVSTFNELAIFRGVDAGGAGSWSRNRDERDKLLPRVVPPEHRRPPPNTLWEKHREALHAEGVRDPAFEANPRYCQYGDSTEVPGLQAASAPDANLYGTPPLQSIGNEREWVEPRRRRE